MSEYKRLESNLDILEKHNEIHTPIFHLTDGKTHEQDLIRELISDCRDLLNKIENGTLIERPPVKKGERIWLIRKYWDFFGGRTKKEIVGRVVKRIFLNNDNSLTFSCLVIHKGTKLISVVKSTTFNKSWFLTKAKAEAKLKELQNER